MKTNKNRYGRSRGGQPGNNNALKNGLHIKRIVQERKKINEIYRKYKESLTEIEKWIKK